MKTLHFPKLFALILTTMTFLLALSAPSSGKDLCTGEDATLGCLKENFERLHSSNENHFWYILIMAAKDAQQCGPMSETAGFLELVRFQTSDGEFGKFYSAQIENLCTNRPLCFLEALAKLGLKEQKDVIKRLICPQFVEKPSIEAAFTMNGKNPKYRKLVEMYLTESVRME